MTIKPHQRVFCSYAFSGEDTVMVGHRMRTIIDIFQRGGIDVYCNLEDPETIGFHEPKQFIDAALGQLAKCDVMLAIMSSDRRSEGMLMEIGAGLAQGKIIILAQHRSAKGKSYVPDLVHHHFVWKDETDLYEKLADLIEPVSRIAVRAEASG